MRFGNPQMLWLLAMTLPLLGWFLWWAWRKKLQLVAQFVQSRLLAQLTVGVSRLRQKLRLVLLILAVGCILLALARPQWGFDWEEAKQRGLDIVVAIDTSRSMLAEDVRPNRLVRAKLAALDLMKLARRDRLALVPFAGAAFLQCPLTLDEEAFRQSVEALDVGIIPVGGTALTGAIETALEAFKEEGDNYKILVLFTDGEDHDSGVTQAAEKAAAAGMKIFTVGVGTPNGELLRITDENGAASYIKDDQGNVVKSRLDESLLQQIATTTGGFYLSLRGTGAMKTLYDQGLAPLPKSEIAARLVRRYHERYQWPLGLAVALLILELLLPEQKRVRRSDAIVNVANPELRKAVAVLATLFVLFISSTPVTAQTAADKEDENYRKSLTEQKQLEKKLKEVRKQIVNYEERLKRNPNDPRLHYNRGTFAYEDKDFGTAEKELSLALGARDLKLQQRSYYNLGNTQYRLGQQSDDANEKIQQWEKAVNSYKGAVALDAKDTNATFNLDLVKKKLDELKKQQPKQQQKKDQQKQDKQDDQKQDQQQQKKSDSSKDGQKDSQQQKRPQPQSQPDSKPKDEKSQQKQEEQQKADQQKQKEQQQAKQNKSQGGGKGDEKSGEETGASAEGEPGQMTVKEAQQLLDAQKGEERAMIFVPSEKLKTQKRTFKDW